MLVPPNIKVRNIQNIRKVQNHIKRSTSKGIDIIILSKFTRPRELFVPANQISLKRHSKCKTMQILLNWCCLEENFKIGFIVDRLGCGRRNFKALQNSHVFNLHFSN